MSLGKRPGAIMNARQELHRDSPSKLGSGAGADEGRRDQRDPSVESPESLRWCASIHRCGALSFTVGDPRASNLTNSFALQTR